jgi:ParB/RepB/Spo0J family partition protein
MAELKHIPIEKLQPHPDNPRLVLREDVIDGIVAQLKESGAFSEMHAPIVRPLNGHYQVISGHTRREAARRADIKTVPCWVEEMSDEEAFMQLVLSNAQGELSPLEIGIHAFKAVPLQKAGGLTAYAEKIGKDRGYITVLRMAGEVYEHSNKKVAQATFLLEKAKHLAAIHALPRACWIEAAQSIYEMSAADVDAAVKAAIEAVKTIPEELTDIYPAADVALRVFTGRMSPRAVKECVAAMLTLRLRIEELEEETSLDWADKWVWDIRQIEKLTHEINLKLQALRELKATVHQSDAVSFLHSIEDESVDLLITDPPYATDVEDIAAFAAEWVPLAIQKLKPTGRAYICTGAYPEELAAYAAALTAIDGLTVGVPLVWGYNNTVGPAPTHDYKTNIQMVWHVYKQDAPALNTSVLTEKNTLQVINAPDGRNGKRWHAWEKPMELASMLVRHALSQAGAFVIDPFAGTGTFLLAATEQGHVAVGSELDPQMIAIQVERGVTNG